MCTEANERYLKYFRKIYSHFQPPVKNLVTFLNISQTFIIIQIHNSQMYIKHSLLTFRWTKDYLLIIQ